MQFLHSQAAAVHGRKWRVGEFAAIFQPTFAGKSFALPGGMARHQKNPHAQALGRLGGLKGGRARAAKLSARRRQQIARRAAMARWGNR